MLETDATQELKRMSDLVREILGRLTDLATLIRDLVRSADRDSMIMQSEVTGLREMQGATLRHVQEVERAVGLANMVNEMPERSAKRFVESLSAEALATIVPPERINEARKLQYEWRKVRGEADPLHPSPALNNTGAMPTINVTVNDTTGPFKREEVGRQSGSNLINVNIKRKPAEKLIKAVVIGVLAAIGLGIWAVVQSWLSKVVHFGK